MSSIATLSLLLCLLVVRVTSFSSVPAKPLVTSVSRSVPHLGDLKVVCDHSDKGSPKLYVEVDADAWTNLSTVMTGIDESIPVPAECPPFKSLYFSFPVGQSHPPWDGRQFNGEQPGGFGQPHGASVCTLTYHMQNVAIYIGTTTTGSSLVHRHIATTQPHKQP